MFAQLKKFFRNGEEPKLNKPYKLTCQLRSVNGWGAPWIQSFTTKNKRNEMKKELKKMYGRKRCVFVYENLDEESYKRM
jgi:hypothetical protein